MMICKEKQKRSKKELDESGLYDKPIVTEVEQRNFLSAEDYHQYYYKKNQIIIIDTSRFRKSKHIKKIWAKKILPITI